MILQCYGSSSSGNAYSLTADDGTILLLEAGIAPSSVLKGKRLKSIQGMLVSHSHGDHAKHIAKYLDKRVRCYGSDISVQHPLYRITAPYKRYDIGTFSVIPFDLFHDAPCQGFLINHPELSAPILFATDTHSLPPVSFERISSLLIEANYDLPLLLSNVSAGIVDHKRAQRIQDTHMSLPSAIRAAQQLRPTSNIVLLHLSSANSSPSDFLREMLQATGVSTYIADKTLCLEINKEF